MNIMLKNKGVCLIGCGNMGEALICGILKSKLFAGNKITGVDIRRKRLAYIKKKTGISTTVNTIKAVQKSDIVLLAVKPYDVKKVLLEIKDSLTLKKIIISVAAGIPTGYIENLVKKRIPVIRVMPNTPALIGMGASAICRGKYADKKAEDIAEKILGSVGLALKVPENLLDGVTGLSGSGPAYIFYVIESLIKAGVSAGLSEKAARKLVLQTVSGAVNMVIKTGESPESLRKKVTSPGGTTEAALKYLQSRKFQKIIIEAIKVATRRSKELGKKT